MSSVALLLTVLGLPAVSAFEFYFSWSDSPPAQCETVKVQWWQAPGNDRPIPPYTLYLYGLLNPPFIYDIPDSAYDANAGRGEFSVQMQYAAQTKYIVMMSDGHGYASGGTSVLNVVQSSYDSSCAQPDAAASNQTKLDFTFTVSGQARQCERGFELGWDDRYNQDNNPYNFTVLPLDQSFHPYFVELEDGTSSMSDWQLDIPQGSKFTISMNNKNGLGTGGAGNVYEVADGNHECQLQPTLHAGTWPGDIATNTLPPATLPVTVRGASKPTSGSSAKGSSGTGLSTGMIAGIAGGGAAALILIGLAICLLCRRRRRRARESSTAGRPKVDLSSGFGTLRRGPSPPAPMVEPFRNDSATSFGALPNPHRGSAASQSAYSQYHDAPSAPGLAGRGAGNRNTWTRTAETSTSDGYFAGEDTRPSGPGYAGSLPAKSARPVSYDTHRLSSTLSDKSRTSKGASPPGSPYSSGYNVGYEQQLSPPLPPGAGSYSQYLSQPPRSHHSMMAYAQTSGQASQQGESEGSGGFLRHADAGRVDGVAPHESLVELPPLYTDVPRENAPGGASMT